MKKYLLKLVTFCAVLILILQLIKSSVPFYWGNELLAQKIEQIENSEEEYDCLFVGSSFTYRHVVPKIINESTAYNSFNLGVQGQYALESNYLIEKLKAENFVDSQTLLIVDNSYEKPKPIAEVNLNSIRSKYYMDFSRFVMGAKFFLKQKNYQQVYRHFQSYFENTFCVGELSKIVEINLNGFGTLNETISQQKGFYSLTQEAEESEQILKRQISFEKKYEDKKFKKKAETLVLNRVRLNDEKISLYISTGQPIIQKNYFFDRAHYNLKGAKKYSQILAKCINELD